MATANPRAQQHRLITVVGDAIQAAADQHITVEDLAEFLGAPVFRLHQIAQAHQCGCDKEHAIR